jgi:RNA recognition motif-containing protein
MVKLFVSGFPLDMDEIELAQIFGMHGDLKTIKLVRDKKTRICKGYGFIEVGDQASADNMVAVLNGHPMGDRQLTVNIRPEDPTPPTPTAPPSYQKVQKPSDTGFKKTRPRIGR